MSQKSKDNSIFSGRLIARPVALRSGADDAPWIAAQDAWASLVLTEDGAEAASAHLDALSQERRAFKRLLRHAQPPRRRDAADDAGRAGQSPSRPCHSAQEPKRQSQDQTPAGPSGRTARRRPVRGRGPRRPHELSRPRRRLREGPAQNGKPQSRPARQRSPPEPRRRPPFPQLGQVRQSGKRRRTASRPRRTAEDAVRGYIPQGVTARTKTAASPPTTSKAVGEPSAQPVATPLPRPGAGRRPREPPPKSLTRVEPLRLPGP